MDVAEERREALNSGTKCVFQGRRVLPKAMATGEAKRRDGRLASCSPHGARHLDTLRSPTLKVQWELAQTLVFNQIKKVGLQHA